MGIGEGAGLAAALMWTCSSMIWGKIKLTALALNFFKNWIGVILIVAHLLVVQWLAGEAFLAAPVESWFWLGISGLVGIVVGDTFYFRSLQILGPRLALMVSTAAPLFSAVLTSLILKEVITGRMILGVLLTISGILIVVSEKKKRDESPGLMPGSFGWGTAYGVLGALCQAIGGVFSKKGMLDVETGQRICSAAEATMIRITVAAIATTVVIALSGKLVATSRSGLRRENIAWLIPATAVGTWIGIWLSQIAYQMATNVAVAQTLLATCPIFAIPVVWVLYGQRPTLLALLGTIVAIVGVYLTT